MSQSNYRWLARRGDIKRLFDEDQHVQSQWTFESPLWLGEMDEALEPRDDYGQLWVKTPVDEESPNTLWYTDDLGTDYQLTGGDGDDHFTSVYISEQPAAQADEVGWGQVWVYDQPSPGMTADAAFSPIESSLWFKDGNGLDVPLVADATPILQTQWHFVGAVGMSSPLRLVAGPSITDSGCLNFEPRSSDPSIPAGGSYLYTKGSPTQLFFRNNAGTITQLTP